jgi:repressor LexA
MEGLTPRQRRIVEFIQETVRDRGYPPTVREIGEAVGLTSSSSVHSQLRNLERKGYITKDAAKPRTIGLPTEAHAVSVPLVGRIAAGSPTLAVEDAEDYLAVPQDFAGEDEHFALRVAGDSMIGAGILDGDLVVIRAQDDARDGEIVAALLPGVAEEEATVKRLRRQDGRVMLVPENPALEPFEMTEGRILGVVTAVMRKL